ncbi:helix-turn-helix domain-containing protein [Ectobacillus sp. JY-23]|uniref:helix-turn-helix domain-containing protein n=1 Tax=Ectobacillus sp. JY-23 TaxID=2933872 RepID=UPI001FF2DD82|nr:helix-turn-helix transcriptional regulator [Ectobacillus sp. JY-23]UOY91112.1 helix-turn-helix domain-containing protein [Ectobacillus sp. JY-23]
MMLEGEIIKFYRKKAGLTQEQLGKGICSTTHVSKIERGQTAYSPEIIKLFSERLHIDIEKEMEALRDIESRLQQWHTAMIMQRPKEMDSIKEELAAFPFLMASNYAVLYQLLQARYWIMKMDIQRARTLLQHVQDKYSDFSPYEMSLLRHVLGMFYINEFSSSESDNHQKAIQVLREIRIEEYGNPEYYYHLAVAYHCISARVPAYLYAEKALQHFKHTNNFLRAFNAESIMLLQMAEDTRLDFREVAARYERLIEDTEIFQANGIKAMLLNNLGYEYFRRNEYALAHPFYQRAMQMAEPSTIIYIQRLYSYLNNGFEGKLIPKGKLIQKVKEGLAAAKERKSYLYKLLFQLLLYRIEGAEEAYYEVLEKQAFPYFVSNRHMTLLHRYGKQLYEYYANSKQYEKAVAITAIFMEPIH